MKNYMKEEGGAYLAHSRNVGVIPGIVVHQYCPVSHCCDLIAIIPPRHDLGIFGSVLSKPIVCLTKIIKYDSRTVMLTSSQNNGGGRIGFRCNLTHHITWADT